MKLMYGGVHKNIGFLIQHIGGYDEEYHITKLAENLNIDKNIIKQLFKESRKLNLDHYIELLENGMSIEEVFKLIDKDNKIATKNFRTTMAYMSGLVSSSGYSRLL